MAVIEKTLQIGVSLKAAKRKLAIDKDRMYALRDERGKLTPNVDEIIKAAGGFYTLLYASDVRLGEITKSISLTCDVPLLTKEEVGKALKGIKRVKSAGNGDITVDLLKEEGDIVL